MLKPILFILAVTVAGSVLAAEGGCPPAVHAPEQYGPYDYSDPADYSERLPIVEQYHFTANVQSFKPENENPPGAHLDYILRAFPNHYRALELMMRLAEKEHTTRPSGANFTVECYFERALNFRPKDATVKMLYANYLHKQGHDKEALAQYELALKLNPSDPTIHYNMGLVYFDTHDYGKSLEHAQAAYKAGFPLPGLKNKLQRIGKWQGAGTDNHASGSASAAPAPQSR